MIDSNKNNQFSEVDVELPSVENASKGETSKKDITIELDLRKTKPLPKLDNRKRILQELVSNDTYLNSLQSFTSSLHELNHLTSALPTTN